MRSRAQLSWIQQDYLDQNQDVPDCLINDNVHTEGELMRRDDIDEWIKDTVATFCLVRERDESRFDCLFDDFIADIDYLSKLGKLTEEEAESIKNKDLYKFET